MRKIAGFVARHIKNQTKFIVIILVAVLTGSAGSAIVFASIPDSNGVIHACYGTGLLNKGDVRIIDNSTENCSINETAISWNQQGPQGPAGSGNSGTVGHALTLSWGAIPSGGTPQLLYTVPGFGNIYVTECDSSGNFDYSFTNTSGQTIDYDDGSGNTIAPNGVVSYSSGDFPYNASIGNGANSEIAVIQVTSNTSTSAQTCTFDGLGLVSSN